jgi:stage V sporulation protein D (sporulation-specific penicillin-binding protein)
MRPSLNIRRKLFYSFVAFQLVLVMLVFRVLYIQVFQGEDLQARAFEQQTRDRLIRPNRGSIYDRNMVGLAVTETVASISVIYAQIVDLPATARALAEILELDEAQVLEKISQRVALVRVAQKVDKDTADRLRALDLPGVVIDEDIRRIYPFGSLGSHLIGFVGRDNQGIIGLEAKYDRYLKGTPGRILTETDAAGREAPGGEVIRIEPVNGYSRLSL